MSIELDKERHVYINTVTGETYTSVTNFISKYKKPFDKEFWSKKIAQREGVDPSVILDTWKSLTQTAQDKGTNIHTVMENFLKDGSIEPGYEVLVDSFTKKTSSIIKQNSKILSESIVHLDEHQLAGMADLIVVNGNIFYVLDFKTNKKFNFQSKYNEYLLEPIDYLPQCEFTTYTLQLSIYAYMFEQMTGKKCGGLKIFYLREFEGSFWQEINCAYMRGAVQDMLDHRQNIALAFQETYNTLLAV